jgi:uncharacterized protein involved in response to NO
MSKKVAPLFALGFRPFYLLAALWSVIAITEWLFELNGYSFRGNSPIPGIQWHAHEMIFGFAATVVAGFALTAVRAWTGLDTPTGTSLMLLVLLWVGGRVAPLISPYLAFIDVLFLPAIAIAIGRLIIYRRMYRNLFLPFILSVLGVLNAIFYLSALDHIQIDANKVLMISLFLIVMIEIMIGGRVIPSFTANAFFGLKQVRNKNFSTLVLASCGASFLLWIFAPANPVTAIACLFTGVIQFALLWGWRPFATFAKPIVLVLHAAYFWIPLGFILLGLSALGLVTIYIPVHAFGIGATAGLIIGMITRTAMGHTGRQLIAGAIEILSYSLVQATAIFWMLAHLLNGTWFHSTIGWAGVFWCTAFLLYLYKYIPWLTSPRVDGQPG